MSTAAAAPTTTVKVFVGNLAFSTTDEELRESFAGSGNVVSANIISRGRRSLGYGFVEFNTDAEANKAVADMHKKDIAGRPVNVEVAKPRVESAHTAPQGDRPPRGPRGGFRGGRGAPRGAGATPGAPAPAGDAPGGFVQRGRGRGRGRGVRGRGRGAPRQHASTQESRPLSQSTLFVANLPFATDDAELVTMFAAFKPKAAHVVKMRNGRSRGYGFVEFNDEPGQLAALNGMHDKEVQSTNGPRTLSVKVAMADNPRENANHPDNQPTN